jgi:hypothetical protein
MWKVHLKYKWELTNPENKGPTPGPTNGEVVYNTKGYTISSLLKRSEKVPLATAINADAKNPDINLPKSIPPILGLKAVKNWKQVHKSNPNTYVILRPWNSLIGERNIPPVPKPHI